MSQDVPRSQIEALAEQYVTGRMSRRQFVGRLLALGLAFPTVAAVVAACTNAATPAASASAAASAAGSAAASASAAASGSAGASGAAASPPDLTALIAAAKQEGSLYLTGIPPEWANYQGMFDLWDQKYGIKRDGVATEGEYSSGQELDSIKNTGKPDVGDVGFIFGAQAKTAGLVADHKHAYWADIAANLKDPDGAWCSTYYGAMSFLINTDAVKITITDWKDLLDPSLKNAVGIDGDPNKANDSFMAVWSASYANGGGEDSIQQGVDFFNKLKQAGNLTPARCNQANMLSGEVKVGIKWDYLALGDRDKAAGSPNFKVILPPSGTLAGPYVSIISAKAPHPNAAKLWNELIYSDEGQINYLKGYAHPIRFDVLNKAGKIPADVLAKLPDPASYANVKFVVDSAKISAAQAQLKSSWNIVVNS